MPNYRQVRQFILFNSNAHKKLTLNKPSHIHFSNFILFIFILVRVRDTTSNRITNQRTEGHQFRNSFHSVINLINCLIKLEYIRLHTAYTHHDTTYFIA